MVNTVEQYACFKLEPHTQGKDDAWLYELYVRQMEQLLDEKSDASLS